MTNKRIILADDSKANRMLISLMLKKIGVTVDAVTNGKEVIEKLLQDDYDLLLTDIHMPEMDGLETTEFIRTKFTGSKKNIKIIALTGAFSEVRTDAFHHSGMDDYLIKPCKPQELYQKIADHLNLERPFSMVS